MAKLTKKVKPATAKLIKHVDPGLWRSVKMRAAEEGIGSNDYVLRAISAAVSRDARQ